MSKENTIKHDGDTWRIVGLGAMRDGKIYCHLASTTRGVQQKTGWNPMQIGDWVDADLVRPCLVQREEEERQLLELAAKAAKIEAAWQDWGNGDGFKFYVIKPESGLLHEWNPLKSDGDALRLAVKLDIDIQFNRAEDEQTVQAVWPDPNDPYSGATFTELFAPDKSASTRRAIVMAAAEIGRKMGDTE